MEILYLGGFAFLAGFIDSVVGGGGLIQLPALLLLLPAESSVNVATVLGTNKMSSIWGTGLAVIQYSRRIRIHWFSILPAAVTAFVFAWLGAMAVAGLDRAMLEPVILVLLVVVAAYTFTKKDFGDLHAPAFVAHRERLAGVAMGGILGFYDGFFGPGMGSFLIFTFIGVFGFDFLSASASAKVINFATNLSSVVFFAATGHILYEYALPMAVCQMGGSYLGTHVAITRGNRFVRLLFLGVAGALIARFGWEVLR